MKQSTSVFIAVFWRVFTAAVTRTFFQPDEFYQSLEVAHHIVFGYGHLTWEWMKSPPIRSILFPSLYIPLYAGLKATKLDETYALIVAPKVLQGMIAAITDVSTRELAKRLLGKRYADTAFFLSLTSFFHLLCLGRTLSNSVETSLTTAALCFWPWHGKPSFRQMSTALAIASLSCMIRPTSAITWAFLFVNTVWTCRRDLQSLRTLFFIIAFIGSISVSLQFFLDSLYFDIPTFTPLNFATTNLTSVSLFYGQSPWHYYLTQALPIALNIYLPYFILSSWKILNSGHPHQKTSLYLTMWIISIYSILGHKEWRFIHPVLPLMLIIVARELVEHRLPPERDPDSRLRYRKIVNNFRIAFSKVWVLALLNLLPGIYILGFHGRAQISVMAHLRSLNESDLRSVGFLMPCHSVPWHAYLHKPHLARNGNMWALSCEPPLAGQNISIYRDQTDVFYMSPLSYLQTNFPKTVDPSFPPSPYPSTSPASPPPEDEKWDHRWPSHLAFFDSLMKEEKDGLNIRNYLRNLGYREAWIGENGPEEDWRRRGAIRIWQWVASSTM